jgi:hypothetical protein
VTKLEQCPFCWGNNSEVAVVDRRVAQRNGGYLMIDRFAVICNACGTTGPDALNAEEAIRRWNIRGPVDEGLIKYIEAVRKT